MALRSFEIQYHAPGGFEPELSAKDRPLLLLYFASRRRGELVLFDDLLGREEGAKINYSMQSLAFSVHYLRGCISVDLLSILGGGDLNLKKAWPTRNTSRARRLQTGRVNL